jgi:pimeloyl-ACP methyl ester carboxylesterase
MGVAKLAPKGPSRNQSGRSHAAAKCQESVINSISRCRDLSVLATRSDSSWGEVIPRLQAAGLHVTAVQNPLTSLADSLAATRRALALQDGPTVLAAHSWGGTVISEVGTDPKVTALVHVAARAPDAGEDFVALSAKFPTMPARAGVQEHDGFTNLSEDVFLKFFANGVAHEKAEVLYAEQEPTTASLFGGRTTVAASTAGRPRPNGIRMR